MKGEILFETLEKMPSKPGEQSVLRPFAQPLHNQLHEKQTKLGVCLRAAKGF